MCSRLRERMPVRADQYGLAAGRQHIGPSSFPWGSLAHVHTDIELNLVEAGRLTYFASGGFHAIRPGRLTALWAGMPHALTHVEEGTVYTWITVPLAWFLQWRVLEAFTFRLLEGEVIEEPARTDDAALEDRLTFARWASALGTPSLPHDVLLLELEARVRRMAALCVRGKRPPKATAEPSGSNVERIARYIALRYREPLTVPLIAQAVGLHPNYVSELFKKSCGIGLWEYVQRLRVSHAQRLLATSDMNVLEVGFECGFSSLGRFYEAFHRFVGDAPGRYRDAVRA